MITARGLESGSPIDVVQSIWGDRWPRVSFCWPQFSTQEQCADAHLTTNPKARRRCAGVWFYAARNLWSFLSNDAGFRVSHSQTIRSFQPSRLSTRRFRRSRSTFERRLVRQNFAFVVNRKEPDS